MKAGFPNIPAANYWNSTFGELEALDVFERPKDINIPVEYLNLSFLIKKPSSR